MDPTFRSSEKARLTKAASQLVEKSPVPTKIEIVKSKQGFVLSSFGLKVEEEPVTKS